MTIETKYTLNDALWYMKDNKPVDYKIVEININAEWRVSGNHVIKIEYKLGSGQSFDESSELIFPSKEELIKSL